MTEKIVIMNEKLKEKLKEYAKSQFKIQRGRVEECKDIKKELLVKYGVGLVNLTSNTTFIAASVVAVDKNEEYHRFDMPNKLKPGQSYAFFTISCDDMDRYALGLASSEGEQIYGPFYPDDEDDFPCADVWKIKDRR